MLERPGGVEIHWEERGEGSLVVLAAYWSGHPGVYTDLLDDLATDHRVVAFDARGTGGSTRTGPYDMATDCADLVALLEAAGGEAVVLATANGSNQAAHVAADRPDLVRAVVSLGVPPTSRDAFDAGEGMIGSDSVVEAFLGMIERDFRGALRSLLTATNTQMSEEELRDRVRVQTEYAGVEPSIGRLRAWLDDDPGEAARAIGDRLWVAYSDDVAGPWLPAGEEFASQVQALVPEARLIHIDDGAVSRPDLMAAVVRQITA
jgi:pimeloyl-ACP methyl ester carboxylesterase